MVRIVSLLNIVAESRINQIIDVLIPRYCNTPKKLYLRIRQSVKFKVVKATDLAAKN